MSSTAPSTAPSSPVKLPAFDNTLGALFIGHTVASVLYGIGCLQLFVYMTQRRSQMDRPWLKLLVYILFVSQTAVSLKPQKLLLTDGTVVNALETAHQAMMSAGMYRFLVTDYLNPLALPSGGPGSGEVFIYAQSLLLDITATIVQLFFCRRIWMLSGLRFKLKHRIPFIMFIVSLSLFSFGSSLDLAITGFNHRILTGNTPEFILAFKLSTSSQVAFDVIVTATMTFFLTSAQTTIERTNRVIKIIIVFIVNCNIMSTALSIFSLATFLGFPHATIYGGSGFLLGKTYFNSFLAILNSRDFLSDKLSETTVEDRQFRFATAELTADSATAGNEYELPDLGITFSTISRGKSEKGSISKPA